MRKKKYESEPITIIVCPKGLPEEQMEHMPTRRELTLTELLTTLRWHYQGKIRKLPSLKRLKQKLKQVKQGTVNTIRIPLLLR